MKTPRAKIPQLSLLLRNKPVNFLCKTMQQIEEDENDQLQLPHRHDYYTIIWIEKANGTHHIDFKSYLVRSQTIYFIGPEQVHLLQLNRKPKGRVFLFTVDFLETNGIPLHFISGLGLFFACDEFTPIRLKPSQVAEMQTYAEHIFLEFAGDHYLKQETIATWLKLFLIACKRMKAERTDKNALPPNSRSKTVREFKSLLEKKFAQHHKVSYYASELHLTANYLNEVIREETGQSAKDLIQNRIILEAKRLATYSANSLKETAYQLGFDDPSHFSKFFRNCTHTGYSTFSRQIRKIYL